MSLISHAFAGLVCLNVGVVIGWVFANARVTHPGEETSGAQARVSDTPDEDPRGDA